MGERLRHSIRWERGCSTQKRWSVPWLWPLGHWGKFLSGSRAETSGCRVFWISKQTVLAMGTGRAMCAARPQARSNPPCQSAGPKIQMVSLALARVRVVVVVVVEDVG